MYFNVSTIAVHVHDIVMHGLELNALTRFLVSILFGVSPSQSYIATFYIANQIPFLFQYRSIAILSG